nr:hypothetical protein [Tanacetum cinerariifolium]
MCELACQLIQKKKEEKQIEEEQAANAQYWKIPAYEVIESSDENLVPIPSEFEALKDNPTLFFEFLTKSSSTSPKSVLEETNTFDDSLPDFENFCFDLEEISCGSTTTHSDISLPDYEAFSFYDDH